MFCQWVCYKKKNLACLKSLKKGVGSGVRSWSISQRSDPHQNVTDLQHWKKIMSNCWLLNFYASAQRKSRVVQCSIKATETEIRGITTSTGKPAAGKTGMNYGIHRNFCRYRYRTGTIFVKERLLQRMWNSFSVNRVPGYRMLKNLSNVKSIQGLSWFEDH
jgi:hypothetical protein